jgi:hypothetical protein
MAAYEWVLKTPQIREFNCRETKAVEVEESVVGDDGAPVLQNVKKSITEMVVTPHRTNIVRLSTILNDVDNRRLFVRFYYGLLEDGQFKPAALDDGVVFGGPTYIDHEFHTEPTTIEEAELLPKIAAALKWDGSMRAITA